MNKPPKKKYSRAKNIFLCGMPASGKSTFGRIYARHSYRVLMDLDRLIVQKTKKKIPDIFRESGEEGFRSVEHDVLMSLKERYATVIALGGGALLDPRHIEFVKSMGYLVYLKTPLETLMKRIQEAKETRPLFAELQTEAALKERLTEMLAQRGPAYEQADVTLNTDFSSIDTLKFELEDFEKRHASKAYLAELDWVTSGPH